MIALIGTSLSVVFGPSDDETQNISIPAEASVAVLTFSSWQNPDGASVSQVSSPAMTLTGLSQLPKNGNLYNAGFAIFQVNASGASTLRIQGSSANEAGPICFLSFFSGTTAEQVVREYSIERTDFGQATGTISFEEGDLVICFDSTESGDIPEAPTNFTGLVTQTNGANFTARGLLSVRASGSSPLTVTSFNNVFQSQILLALREFVAEPPVTKKRVILVS